MVSRVGTFLSQSKLIINTNIDIPGRNSQECNPLRGIVSSRGLYSALVVRRKTFDFLSVQCFPLFRLVTLVKSLHVLDQTNGGEFSIVWTSHSGSTKRYVDEEQLLLASS